MFHGMVQNKSLDLFHSIVKGAVEAESKFICAALQCHLGGPMSSDKGPRTKEACMFHGMVQNKSLEDLFHSIVEGAVEAEEKFICAALQYHLGGPVSRDEGPPPVVLAVRVSARRCRPGAPRRQRTPRELTRGPQRRALRSSRPLATGLSGNK